MVALFNAIAKAKRDSAATEDSSKPKKTLSASTSVAVADDSSLISKENSVRGRVAAAKSNKKNEETHAAAGTEGENKGGWAALRDDYMVGQKLTVKVSYFLINIIIIFFFNFKF